MFSRLQEPRGGPSLLAIALALLALAGLSLGLGVPGAAILAGLLAVMGLGCGVAWWVRRRSARYDLHRLFDEPPPADDQPYEDHVPAGHEGSPYCGWCDEAYAPGTRRCLRCGREL